MPARDTGLRILAIPEVIAPVVQWHLACFASDGDEEMIFTIPEGTPLHHSNFGRRIWQPALRDTGLTSLDLSPG